MKMDTTMLKRIRTHLVQKRATLGEWLGTSSNDKKTILLGSSSQAAVRAHLDAIDTAVEKCDCGELGVCKVCGLSVDDNLLEMDYNADVCIEHLSSEEIDRLEDELELVKDVQKALLPQDAPNIPGLDVAAYSRPAAYVGGDYFDFIDFNEETHGLLIADVAGHGVSASLQMASLQALARVIIPASDSPAQVVENIHDLFGHNIRFDTFVTMFIAAFSPATKMFTYCNAGHNPPLLLQADGGQSTTENWLRPTGPAVGLVEEPEFGQRALPLHQGDLMVMYTDGVVEAANPANNFFGVDHLAEVVRRLHASSPREVVRGIRQSLESFVMGKPLSDDITLVVCRST
jgi:sigma-B regulation protein RsbU (phosphoserine phosphatase)